MSVQQAVSLFLLTLVLLLGHSHSSGVTIINDHDGVPLQIEYIVGSVTPYTDLNPGWRIYRYNRSLADQYIGMLVCFVCGCLLFVFGGRNFVVPSLLAI